MSEEYFLDAKPFAEILHMMLRHDGVDELEHDRLPHAYDWLQQRNPVLRRIMTAAEWAVLSLVWRHWTQSGSQKIAPSRYDVGELIRGEQQCQPLLDALQTYDDYLPDLERDGVLSSGSMELSMVKRREQYERNKMSRICGIASAIAQTGLEVDKKTKLLGPRDAINYLMKKVQEGILVDDKPAEGGVLAGMLAKVASGYDIAASLRRANKLFIPTGVNAFDSHLGGLRYKEVNGILGFVGQRKSGLARTIAFNAAKNGFRVLHIPLESDVAEERMIYSVIFAQESGLCGPGSTISKSNVERGHLSDADRRGFFASIEKFEQQVAGNIIIRSPQAATWSDVKSIIEQETFDKAIDLVVLDYLTLLGTPGTRDEVADKTAIIQDVKRLAMTANDGRGLCILTPVQGNRQGFTEAANNGGVWESHRIFKYSELEKSLDNVFYVFMNEAMASANQIVVGSCKTRRDKHVPSSLVRVHPASGMFDPFEPQQKKPGGRGAGVLTRYGYTPRSVRKQSLAMDDGG